MGYNSKQSAINYTIEPNSKRYSLNSKRKSRCNC